jgi:hypothetical protein
MTDRIDDFEALDRIVGAEAVAEAIANAQPAGAILLDDVHAFLGRFIAYPGGHSRTAHALWIAHAHFMKAWESTPRLAFLSPEPGSGKTRALEITELLVPRAVSAVNMSPSALFRVIGSKDGLPTILFDEIDTIFGPKARENEELRGLLNAGYRRGAKTYRSLVTGKKVTVEEIEAFSAVALAGLNDLPDTILTRSIVVRMRRRAPGETVESYRRRMHADQGRDLHDRLAKWARANEERAATAWPDMPTEITDRNADCWEALLTVADLAGGHWPETARVAAVALVADTQTNRESLGVKLLSDIRKAFAGADQMATALLLEALNAMEESPWGDLKGAPLDARRLSRMLSKYGVKPTTIRTGTGTPKGYRSLDLYDAWQRYLPSLAPENSATSATIATSCARCDGDGCDWCSQ